MKIESHDLQTHTQRSFSQEYLHSEVDFQLVLAPFQNVSTQQVTDEVKQPPSYEHPLTLYSIIESLIASFNQQTDAYRENIEATRNSPQLMQRISIQERYIEEESVSFSTKGNIKTDSQSIDIDVNFSMSRSFMIDNRIDVTQQFDPLVINIEGEIPSLSSNKFSFDLDNDGKKDQISQLNRGSGFLALDKNNDGDINEGSELFGTLLGNGFAELSKYDSDNNDWIDENDSIFDQLQIWFGNDSEEKSLVGLGEVGIGAIFLQSQQSEFTYKTASNETLGELKSSGIVLNENGTVSNISQIDFSVQNSKKESALSPLQTLLRA